MSRRNRDRKQRKRLEKGSSESRRVPLTVVDMATTQVLWHHHGGELPDRECGECTACCTSIGVESLGKPPNCRCEHESEAGCGVYEDRPDECRYWFCCWRLGWGEEHDRPDRSGVLLTIQGTSKESLSLDVIELWRSALSKRFSRVVNGTQVVDMGPLINLIPPGWTLDIIRDGVPRPSRGRVDKSYNGNGPGDDYLIGSLPVRFVMGYIDPDGNFHGHNDQFVPKEEFDNLKESSEWRREQVELLLQK